MLQKLEKEIDDVDNKIGNRWRLLDRSVWTSVRLFSRLRIMIWQSINSILSVQRLWW